MQEPVIIPYDAPIPQMVDTAPAQEEKLASSEETNKGKPSSSDSALSDALLENLNQLLNGK